tara:strand:- start:204 stop:416 length:213 start_codon:yes stop_codon:yes gene_type:complete
VGKINQTRTVEHNNNISSIGKSFEKKETLNLNDLLQRRKQEEQVDKKTNLLIISGATAVATGVVLAVLSI